MIALIRVCDNVRRYDIAVETKETDGNIIRDKAGEKGLFVDLDDKDWAGIDFSFNRIGRKALESMGIVVHNID